MQRTLTGLGLFALLLAVLPHPAQAQEAPADTLQPTQAIEHVGEAAFVCGEVASTNYAAGSDGRPTFLNLGRPYPNHVFTAVIWGEDRGDFEEAPDAAFADKHICVSGEIDTYQGKAQIVVERRDQIEVVKNGPKTQPRRNVGPN